MTTETWEQARQVGIGGSDAAACLGLSPWVTPRMLWESKSGLRDGPRMNEAMEWGHRLESAVLEKLADAVGVVPVSPMLVAAELLGEDTGSRWSERVAEVLRGKVTPRPFDDGHVLWTAARPLPFGAEAFALATVDAFGLDRTTGDVCILEAKTTGAHNAKRWIDAPPDTARLQVVHYLAVFPLLRGWIGCLAGGNRWCGQHEILVSGPDDAIVTALLHAEADMVRRIVEDDPPPEVERDAEIAERAKKPRTVRLTLTHGEAGSLYGCLDGMLQHVERGTFPDVEALRDKVQAAALRGAQ